MNTKKLEFLDQDTLRIINIQNRYYIQYSFAGYALFKSGYHGCFLDHINETIGYKISMISSHEECDGLSIRLENHNILIFGRVKGRKDSVILKRINVQFQHLEKILKYNNNNEFKLFNEEYTKLIKLYFQHKNNLQKSEDEKVYNHLKKKLGK